MVALQTANPVTLAGGLLLVVVGVTLYSAVEIVDAHEQKALTVSGEYRRLLESGLHVVPPFVATTESIDMRTQQATLTVEATTADDHAVTVGVAVDVAVTDAERVYLETDDYRRDLLEAVEASLERAVGEVDEAELLADPEAVADRVRLTVERRTAGWGIEVEDVEMTTIDAGTGTGSG